MTGFLIPFLTIAMLEFGDKTQLMLVMLTAAGHHNPEKVSVGGKAKKMIFWGAMTAFLIVDGLAVLAGALVITIIPRFYIKIAAGILFIIMGMWTVREFFKKSEEEEQEKITAIPTDNYSNKMFLASFGAILLTEWGDKTQIAAAMFATKFNGFLVLAGALGALGILSAMAVWAGDVIGKKFSPRLIHLVAGALFIATGAVTLLLK